MQELSCYGYKANVDKSVTANWYAGAGDWGCECLHCRNVLVQTESLPKPLLGALELLGIPPRKATYLCQLYDENGRHLYQVSWRVAGEITEAPAKEQDPDWGTLRFCHETYPYGAPDFPQPHFDLEAYLWLPWVLPEEDK